MKYQLHRLALTLALVANSAIPLWGSEKPTLPELLTLAHADCDRQDFLQIASGFPLDSQKMAAIELAANRLNQIDTDSSEKKRAFCQVVVRMIENRRAFDVLTWDAPTSQQEWLTFMIATLKAQTGSR